MATVVEATIQERNGSLWKMFEGEREVKRQEFLRITSFNSKLNRNSSDGSEIEAPNGILMLP
jgi:hypothetical protein